MDIKANLFTPTTPQPQSSGNASEARRAFEAMLSASAARTRHAQSPHSSQEAPVGRSMEIVSRVQTQAPVASADAPSRPGRVLDIKV